MVGFSQSPAIDEAIKEEKEDFSLSASGKPLIPNDPLDLSVPELEDFSVLFSDSFLDFDSTNGWLLEGNPGFSNMADLGGNDPVDFDSVLRELEDSNENLEVDDGGICKRDRVKEESLWGLEQEKGENGVVGKSDEMGSEKVSEEVDEKEVLGGDGSSRDLGGLHLGCLIEEQLRKVSIEGASDCSAPISGSGEDSLGGACNSEAGGAAVVVGKETKIDENGGDEDESESDEESESESESSSSSTSSSSSSSSSSDEEEDEDCGNISGEKKDKNEDVILDIEDGEILLSDAEEMAVWGEDEDADDDSGGSRPIMSKNEIKDLPPVPAVNVTLEPHHQTLPVGTILSILGPQVIVEGVEKHSPLSEGSILWLTESRSPLGIIDEIFGPVKNPFYIVRYNCETEVPPGIQQGTPISFVQDFANHILNDKSLYRKGYDASGEHDEELSDEIEFSDDEKEAEYRRMIKMKKRGTNESKPGNKRKDKRQQKNQKGNWNKNQDPANNPSSSGFGQASATDQAVVPPFPQRPQAPGFPAFNGAWSNGYPHHQRPNLNLPTGGFPADGMLWMQQNLPFQLCPPMQSNAAFQQQIGMMPRLPMNLSSMGGPMLTPWAMGLNQNALNSLQFGMGLQGQQALQPPNSSGEQVAQSQGSHISHNLQPLQFGMGLQAQQPLQAPNGSGEQVTQSQGSHTSHNLQPSPAALNFNQAGGGGGADGGRGGGRRGHHRGRGRTGGGRGRHS